MSLSSTLRIVMTVVFLLPGLLDAGERRTRVVDGRFDLLRTACERTGAAGRQLQVTIRFQTAPSESLLRRIAGEGVAFIYKDGHAVGSKTVYPAVLNFSQLARLASLPEVTWIEPDCHLLSRAPLDTSRVEVQAEATWARLDQRGKKLIGSGVLIADFDTGVDYFHPLLFFADGDTADWVDVDGNGLFSPGVDAVDRNGNGRADAGEILRYVELPYSPYNTPSVYDANLDFLYNDVNNNGVRDQGTAAGFTELSPTYGEQWFITLDGNSNNRLDPGERLVGLSTSKIRSIRETDGTVRRRGVDLILANPDTGPYGGHGTSVAGIALGGIPGVHRLAGIAPGAEMIVASISYNTEPRFFTGLAAMMAWARSEGAQIMLCEDGEWVWEYLDGSSNEEQMMNEYAAEGVVQVCPAGNLTGGGMQKTMQVPSGDSLTVAFTGGSSNIVWPSVRWVGGADDVALRLSINAVAYVTLPGNGTSITVGGKQVYSLLATSSRGTTMMMIRIGSSGLTTDSLRIVNHSAKALRIEGMLGDDGMGWGGLARWTAPSEDNTVTWPATADSAIGIGAYKSKSTNTDINTYSGRGTRIDGHRCVTIAAPGSIVYSIGRNATYTPFGGTSSAGPHVAGAAALLLQADSSLGNGGVRRALAGGALTDQYTGAVPNTTWGYGKLAILNSLSTFTDIADRGGALPSIDRLEQNYPNPFNPTTTIVWQMGSTGQVRVAVFDILGREVALLHDGQLQAGRHSLVWNAANAGSGVYFCRLTINGRAIGTKSMLVIR